MLQKYIESDFEFLNTDNSRISLLKRSSDLKSSTFLNILERTDLYFLFTNVVNIEIFTLHRFMLAFWILTGFLGHVSCYKSSLRLGIWYYSFKINLSLKNKFFLRMLSFFSDEFIGNKPYNRIRYFAGDYYYELPELDLLTNLKLARGVYFHKIIEKVYIHLKSKKLKKNETSEKVFINFLNSLKLKNVR